MFIQTRLIYEESLLEKNYSYKFPINSIEFIVYCAFKLLLGKFFKLKIKFQKFVSLRFLNKLFNI